MRIDAPDASRGHESYEEACERALAGVFQEMTQAAEIAGWDSFIVARAVLSLALCHIATRLGDDFAQEERSAADGDRVVVAYPTGRSG